ncbi:MAG: hypothetical protein KDA29_14020 [Phycisphaerales bacterium]|nr:hypothetical protein [Phycisphaerales bacterium]
MKKLLLLTGLFAILPVEATIYQWADDQGISQFGDCPPAKCGSVKVDLEPLVILHSEPLTPAPTPRQTAEAADQTALNAGLRIVDESVTYPELGLNPPLSRGQCHSSPDAMQEPDWDRLLQPTAGQNLAQASNDKIKALLQSLDGLWHGSLSETRFLMGGQSSHSDKREFLVNAALRQMEPGLVRLDLELDGRNNDQTSRSEALWFSVGRNNVQSGDDRPAGHKNRQWDHRVLRADTNTLEIVRSYRRFGNPGHSVHHLSYRSLEKQARGINITECLYVQGVIANVRQWTLVR